MVKGGKWKQLKRRILIYCHLSLLKRKTLVPRLSNNENVWVIISKSKVLIMAQEWLYIDTIKLLIFKCKFNNLKKNISQEMFMDTKTKYETVVSF